MSANWQSRWHPLLQQWTIISASSAARPWSGDVVTITGNAQPVHDPDCYLCPRIKRASGITNPDYQGPWAFDNDYPSLALSAPDPIHDPPDYPPLHNSGTNSPLHRTQAAVGICRVMCWSQRHNTTLAELSASEMRAVVSLWKDEFTRLSQQAQISQVLMFENKGREIGVSNLHPHGQIYAMGFVSDNALRMRSAQHEYRQANAGRTMLQDLIQHEDYVATRDQSLLVEQSEHFKVIVPFAARLPYETWIVPVRHVNSIDQLSVAELDDLSVMYQRQTQRYDSLFQRSSPNVTLLQNAPCDDNKTNEAWCFHISMMPPLRDATTLKYMAGFETGSNNVVNPVQPEKAAAALRDCHPSGAGA